MTQKEINTILKDVKSKIENINDIRGSYNTLKNVMESIDFIFTTDMEHAENALNLMNKNCNRYGTSINPYAEMIKMFAERMMILTMYDLSDKKSDEVHR